MTLVSRRQAVYLTGTGLTAATVTACAPKVQPVGNDASPSPGGTASAESAASGCGGLPHQHRMVCKVLGRTIKDL